ncbi:MAG: hypothetical protein IPG52_10720 [Rhodocyclaceae bacterium]|nr:hypothetical protein [Rhodocyclaceae bacterium]
MRRLAESSKATRRSDSSRTSWSKVCCTTARSPTTRAFCSIGVRAMMKLRASW